MRAVRATDNAKCVLYVALVSCLIVGASAIDTYTVQVERVWSAKRGARVDSQLDGGVLGKCVHGARRKELLCGLGTTEDLKQDRKVRWVVGGVINEERLGIDVLETAS